MLMQAPVVPMSFLRAKPIGVMQMIDQGEQDDKIIAVHADDPEFRDYDDIKQLPKHRLAEIRRCANFCLACGLRNMAAAKLVNLEKWRLQSWQCGTQRTALVGVVYVDLHAPKQQKVLVQGLRSVSVVYSCCWHIFAVH